MTRLGLRVEPDAIFSVQDAGTSTNLRGLGFNEIHAIAKLAEDLGYDSLWLPEGFGRDAVVFLSAIGISTQQIKLATGILSTYTRTPTMIAMASATMDELTNGRFILGLGVGHKPSTEGGHGVVFDRPVTRGKETIEIVRQLLKGASVSFDGKVFQTNKATLNVQATQNPIPVYLAALKPKMVQLAGEIADGVLLNFSPQDYLKKAVELVRRGEALGAREPGSCDIACYVRVAITDDYEASKPVLQQVLAGRLRLPFYARYFEELGFEEETRGIITALNRGDDTAAATAVTDRLIHAMVIVGTAAECRERLTELRQLGLGLPIIAPIRVGEARLSLGNAIRALAPEA